jgi:hypothetical protein
VRISFFFLFVFFFFVFVFVFVFVCFLFVCFVLFVFFFFFFFFFELHEYILFERRLGFSGTPSNLLPLELGQSNYEAGSDGKMMNYLTSPSVVSCTFVNAAWTPKSILSIQQQQKKKGKERETKKRAGQHNCLLVL